MIAGCAIAFGAPRELPPPSRRRRRLVLAALLLPTVVIVIATLLWPGPHLLSCLQLGALAAQLGATLLSVFILRGSRAAAASAGIGGLCLSWSFTWTITRYYGP